MTQCTDCGIETKTTMETVADKKPYCQKCWERMGKRWFGDEEEINNGTSKTIIGELDKGQEGEAKQRTQSVGEQRVLSK